jgi:hypothetical protein
MTCILVLISISINLELCAELTTHVCRLCSRVGFVRPDAKEEPIDSTGHYVVTRASK